MSYFRPEIDEMEGYVPGEQPKGMTFIKLNTNENPYPPSPEVEKLLKSCDFARLRLYPDPLCTELREAAAELYGVRGENIIIGNGSDDILTIAIRSFTSDKKPLGCMTPTYSLYKVLARIQGAECKEVKLNGDFSLPENLLEQASGTGLFIFARPNAPTGNSFPIELIEKFCAGFDGAVMIDEAYADFARENCLGLVGKYPNVIICRTLSKSYSLAGARLGLAVASPEIIAGMMKVKDSYNVNMLTQKIAAAAIRDQAYFTEITGKIKKTRKRLNEELRKLSFAATESETNFLFVSPPDGDGEKYYEYLRKSLILVRYFPGDMTGHCVRITVGTDDETDKLLELTSKYVRSA
ncbi:MAG: histidinol-phosphate transaminase [Lentisphaerae bacterium GWF2_45_14]|nr:MAG: histidinol-phosphate transaminase [Lentisphaerae bacterium GWF2_45_14]